jgi:hypothetical protein
VSSLVFSCLVFSFLFFFSSLPVPVFLIHAAMRWSVSGLDNKGKKDVLKKRLLDSLKGEGGGDGGQKQDHDAADQANGGDDPMEEEKEQGGAAAGGNDSSSSPSLASSHARPDAIVSLVTLGDQQAGYHIHNPNPGTASCYLLPATC